MTKKPLENCSVDEILNHLVITVEEDPKLSEKEARKISRLYDLAVESMRDSGEFEVPESRRAQRKSMDGGTYYNFLIDIVKELKESGRESNKSAYFRRLVETDIMVNHPDLWRKVFGEYLEEPTT